MQDEEASIGLVVGEIQMDVSRKKVDFRIGHLR